jgi:hypothetical protein
MSWVSKECGEFEVCWGTAAGRGGGLTGVFATVVFTEDCNEDGDGDSDDDSGGGIDSWPGCTDLGRVKSRAEV